MKLKKTVLIFLAFIFAANINAQTIIENGTYVSGVWKKTGSPYIIKGEAIVAVGKVLKIKPGVVVLFKTGENREYGESAFDVAFLRVNGTIIAKGKPNNNILFSRETSKGYWGVIQVVDKTNKSVFSYCKLEYSAYIRNIISGDNATGAISTYKSSPLISNCIITNSWSGINCKEKSKPLIKNNTIVFNKYGIECNTESKPQITNSIIWNNETAFYVNGGSEPSISHTLINENPSKYGIEDKGNNLINKNPLFVDEANENFHLKKKSPCRGKAKNKNIGAL